MSLEDPQMTGGQRNSAHFLLVVVREGDTTSKIRGKSNKSNDVWLGGDASWFRPFLRNIFGDAF